MQIFNISSSNPTYAGINIFLKFALMVRVIFPIQLHSLKVEEAPQVDLMPWVNTRRSSSDTPLPQTTKYDANVDKAKSNKKWSYTSFLGGLMLLHTFGPLTGRRSSPASLWMQPIQPTCKLWINKPMNPRRESNFASQRCHALLKLLHWDVHMSKIHILNAQWYCFGSVTAMLAAGVLPGDVL